jgi:hypothetical protein
MAERDPVLNYRPGPQAETPLEDGEIVLTTFLPNPARYWRDHLWLAAFFFVVVGVVFVAIGIADQIWVGALGVALALGFRAVYFRSEVFARRWRLTETRIIGPQGRVVALGHIAQVRSLMGDVQLVTSGGEKHLIRHLKDTRQAVGQIEAAIDTYRNSRKHR